jgi:hypothetical protein
MKAFSFNAVGTAGNGKKSRVFTKNELTLEFLALYLEVEDSIVTQTFSFRKFQPAPPPV